MLNAKRYAALHYRGAEAPIFASGWPTSICGGRRDDGGQRRLLPAEYSHRGVLHHSAQGARGRRGAGVEAAVAPGDADRKHPLPLRGRRIVEATATAGEDALNRLISTDDGARRLGEVALVPASSPIAAAGILFWSTLFDENAASHIALGQAYSRA